MSNEELVKKIQQQGQMWARSGMRFVEDETLKGIAKMSRTEIDALEIGVVKLDAIGNILLYNKQEAIKANVPVTMAEGKNFFTQIAPCTNNSIFYGSFKKGMDDRSLDLIFPYTFTYKMKPTPVKVHLYRDNVTGTNWIFVKWN
jgi:photoactive yellow protein